MEHRRQRQALTFLRKWRLLVSTIGLGLFFVTSHQKGSIKNIFSSKLEDDGIKVKNSSSEYKTIRDISDSVTERRELKRRLPTCLIIGSKKSGTLALREFLGIHPYIRTARTEQHFFDRDSNFEKGFEFYRRHMPKSYPEQITIEKTPEYFISERATKRIYAFNSSIRLILILRHPVKRMISDFWHELRWCGVMETNCNLEFKDLAFDNRTGNVNKHYESVNVSLYYIHVKRYLEYFPRHQLHVVDGEHFILNPVGEISKIETFLGLEHYVTKDKVFFDDKKGFFCYIKGDARLCLRPSKGHNHPPLEEKYFKKLNDFFEPFNRKLFSLIEQEFIWN